MDQFIPHSLWDLAEATFLKKSEGRENTAVSEEGLFPFQLGAAQACLGVCWGSSWGTEEDLALEPRPGGGMEAYASV